MRREHKSEQSYIDWLKSLGCVFYAPLTENEVNDVIGGGVFSLTAGENMTWDSNKQMWLFEDNVYIPGQNVGGRIGRWTNVSNMGFDITNIGYSLLFEVNIVQNGFHPSYTTPPKGCLIPLVLEGVGGWNLMEANPFEGRTYKISFVYPKYDGSSGRYNTAYADGNQIRNLYIGNTKATGTSQTNSIVNTGFINSYRNAYSGCKYFMKNAMIFNRQLTQQEINEIQEI